MTTSERLGLPKRAVWHDFHSLMRAIHEQGHVGDQPAHLIAQNMMMLRHIQRTERPTIDTWEMYFHDPELRATMMYFFYEDHEVVSTRDPNATALDHVRG